MRNLLLTSVIAALFLSGCVTARRCPPPTDKPGKLKQKLYSPPTKFSNNRFKS